MVELGLSILIIKTIIEGIAEETYKPIVQGAEYFFGMLDFPPGHANITLVRSLVVDSNVMDSILALDFMDAKYPHSLKIIDGLCKFLDFMSIQARRAKQRGTILDLDLPNDIAIFKAMSVEPKKKADLKGKDYRRVSKLSADADEIEKMPESSEIKQVVQEAMALLVVLSFYLAQDNADFNWNWRKIANMLMTGIIFLSTLAGRPGES